MKSRRITASLSVTAWIFVVTVLVAGQDRFSLTSPDGIAFSEFKGYDAWQVIAPSQLDGVVKAIVGNPVMIKAFSERIPVNGRRRVWHIQAARQRARVRQGGLSPVPYGRQGS